MLHFDGVVCSHAISESVLITRSGVCEDGSANGGGNAYGVVVDVKEQENQSLLSTVIAVQTETSSSGWSFVIKLSEVANPKLITQTKSGWAAKTSQRRTEPEGR